MFKLWHSIVAVSGGLASFFAFYAWRQKHGKGLIPRGWNLDAAHWVCSHHSVSQGVTKAEFPSKCPRRPNTNTLCVVLAPQHSDLPLGFLSYF